MFSLMTCSTCSWRARSGRCTTPTWSFKTTLGGKGSHHHHHKQFSMAIHQVWGPWSIHEDCEPFKVDCSHSLCLRTFPHPQDDQAPWGRDYKVPSWLTQQTLTKNCFEMMKELDLAMLFTGFVGELPVWGWWGCWWGTSRTRCGWRATWRGRTCWETLTL